MDPQRTWYEVRSIEILCWKMSKSALDNHDGSQYRLRGYDERGEVFWNFLSLPTNAGQARAEARDLAKRIGERGKKCDVRKEIIYVDRPFVSPELKAIGEAFLAPPRTTYEQQRIKDRYKK